MGSAGPRGGGFGCDRAPPLEQSSLASLHKTTLASPCRYTLGSLRNSRRTLLEPDLWLRTGFARLTGAELAACTSPASDGRREEECGWGSTDLVSDCYHDALVGSSFARAECRLIDSR